MKNTNESVVVELEILTDAALEDVTGGSFRPSVDVGSGFSGTTSSLSTLGGLSVYCTSLGGSFSSYGGGGGSFRYFCALK